MDFGRTTHYQLGHFASIENKKVLWVCHLKLRNAHHPPSPLSHLSFAELPSVGLMCSFSLAILFHMMVVAELARQLISWMTRRSSSKTGLTIFPFTLDV